MGIIRKMRFFLSVAFASIMWVGVTAIAVGCAQHKVVIKEHDIFNANVDFTGSRINGSFEGTRFEITETQPGASPLGSPLECIPKMESAAVEWAKVQGLEVSLRELGVRMLTLHIEHQGSPIYFELVYTYDEAANTSSLSLRVIATEETALKAAAYAGRYDMRSLCATLVRTIRCGSSSPWR